MLPAWVIYRLFQTVVTPCYEDRGTDQTARLEVIAVAIANATDPEGLRTGPGKIAKRDKDVAAKLVTVAVFESALCERVHRGLTRGRGRGLFQLEQGSHAKPPFEGDSLGETINAANEAAKLLRRSVLCGTDVRNVFASYAGLSCGRDFKTLTERVVYYEKIRGRIDEIIKRGLPRSGNDGSDPKSDRENPRPAPKVRQRATFHATLARIP